MTSDLGSKRMEDYDLPNLAVRSALWAGGSHYWLFSLGLVKTMILARLVPPEYFGMVALGQAWVTYLSVFRLDFRAVIVTWEDDSPRTLSVQFWLDNLLSWSGLLLAAGLYWVSPQALFVVGDVPSGWLSAVWVAVFILMLVVGLESLTSTPRYLLERKLRQDILGRLTGLHAVLGLLVAVALAWQGYYLAAILVDVAMPVVVVGIGVTIVTRWRPSLVWDTKLARRMLEFGLTMWTTGLLGKIVFQLDDWLVGTIGHKRQKVWMSSGVLPVSFYSRAYTAGKMPMDVFAGMIGQIALPLYARSAEQGRETLQRAYHHLSWLLAYMIFLSGTFALSATEEVVNIVLGERWLSTVPLFRLMSGFILLRPLYQNACQLLIALRKEKRMRVTVAQQAVFMLLVCPPAVWIWGAAGAGVTVSVMTVIGLFFADRYVRDELGYSAVDTYLLPALTGLGVYGMLSLLKAWLPLSLWGSTVAKGGFCIAMFALVIFLFERHQAQTVWTKVRGALRNGTKH